MFYDRRTRATSVWLLTLTCFLISHHLISPAVAQADAQSFAGSYSYEGLTLEIEQLNSATLQGRLVGSQAQYSLSGQTTSFGIYGNLRSPQGDLAFEGYMNPRATVLVLYLFEYRPDGGIKPGVAQEMIFRRSSQSPNNDFSTTLLNPGDLSPSNQFQDLSDTSVGQTLSPITATPQTLSQTNTSVPTNARHNTGLLPITYPAVTALTAIANNIGSSSTSTAQTDPWLGSYSDATLSMDITGYQAGVYSGTLQLGEQSFSFEARAQHNRLAGNFHHQGSYFDFVALLSNNGLEFETGNTKYQLLKQSPLQYANTPSDPSLVDNSLIPSTLITNTALSSRSDGISASLFENSDPNSILASSSAGDLTQSAVDSWIAAAEFALTESGIDYRFNASEQAQIRQALAQGFPTFDEVVQQLLLHAQDVLEQNRSYWAQMTVQQRHEFSVTVLAILFGEQWTSSRLNLNY